MEGERREGDEEVDKLSCVNRDQAKIKREETRNGIQVSYTNINGFISKRLECMDYLQNNKPDIMCMVETKLRPGSPLEWFKEEPYKVWRNDRKEKEGGGIMVLTKKDLMVKEVNFSKENEEVISVLVTDSKGDSNSLCAAQNKCLELRQLPWDVKKYPRPIEKGNRKEKQSDDSRGLQQ